MSKSKKKSNAPGQSTDEGQDGLVDGAPDKGSQAYDVGYKKPPKHAQFRDGNTFGKGRRRGSKNTSTIVNQALGGKVQAKMGGKVKKLTKIEMAMHQLANKASQGELKAIERAIQLHERYGPQEDSDGPSPEKLRRDMNTLRAFLAMEDLLDPPEDQPATKNGSSQEKEPDDE